MPKILVVTRWYPSVENPVHGVFVKEFARATARHNDVTVLYGELTAQRRPKWPYEIQDELEDGIRTVRFIYRRRPFGLHRIINLIGFGHLFYKLIREGRKPDIVHFHVFLASVSVLVLAKLFRIPMVLSEHWSAFITGNFTLMERLLARLILKQFSIILPVSAYLQKQIDPYVPGARFEVMPNVVDAGVFRPSPVQGKRKAAIKHMLMVGRLDAGKGVPYLLDALNLLKATRDDFFLNIVGDGTQKAALTQRLRALDLIDFAQFHGPLPKREVAEQMSRCDFFVLPTLYETFGCVIAEAMACGKPVVTTAVGALDEIVGPRSGILVQPGDAEALRNGIDFMLDSYASYSSIDIAGAVRERFGPETIGRRLHRIYQEILSSPTTRCIQAKQSTAR